VLQKLLSYIRGQALLRPGDRVGVAVSGGADSVALLRLLLEAREQLGIALSVVHFNHKIRGAEANADQQFAADLARAHDLEFHCDSADTPAYAGAHKLSLEAAGRTLRYEFFERLLHAPASCVTAALPGRRALDKIATAHTRDDQVETVLLRFLRGAGTRGLAGIYPELRAGIVRPLLACTHGELCSYLNCIHQPWREDATNRDISYARNRVRHELLPLLRRGYNPALDQVLAESGEIARADEEYWASELRRILPQVLAAERRIPCPALLAQPLALRRRLVRAAAENAGLRLDFHHVEQILGLAAGPSSRSEKALELPGGWQAVRRAQELWFRRRRQTEQEYDLVLSVPGEVQVAGRTMRAALVRGDAVAHAGEGARATRVLLEAALATRGLRVRNWRAGDRYRPAHTAAPKKLKELLQAPHIPRDQKPLWPVVVGGEEIIWVPGFPPPEQFQPGKAAQTVLLLEELPHGQGGKNGP